MKASKVGSVVAGVVLALSASRATAGALDGGTATGPNGAVAIGNSANASGMGAIAIGTQGSLAGVAAASGTDAIAIGNGSSATHQEATAVGESASAQNAFATSVGSNAAATGFGSYAGGGYSSASNLGVAVGYQAAASGGEFGTAVGAVAKASNANATALGGFATAEGEGSTAVGGYSAGSQANATALGYMAQSTAAGATAVGQGAVASAANSVALGSNSTTTANLATAGYNPGSTALAGVASTANGEVSVGKAGAERRVTSVAAGATGTDAVNVSQLQSEDAKVNNIGSGTAASLGGGATYDPVTGTVTQPTYTIAGTTYNNAGDAITNLAGQAADSVKYNDSTHGSITLGGAGSQTPVELGNVAAGQLTAASTDAVNGSQLYTTNQNVANNANSISTLNNTLNNVVGGTGVKYFHANSTLADSQATGTDAVAIGGNANASGENSVALGSNAVADRQNTVSVGAPGAERQITNMAAGTEGTDAVNLSQLKNAASSAASALGGGSSLQADGTMTMPSYLIGGSTFGNVGAALTNLDGRVTQNANSIASINNTLSNVVSGGGIKYFHIDSTLPDSQATGANAVAIGGNANASADNTVALGANSVADRAGTVSVGAAGNERQITNVKAGTADTDAVNVAQLKSAGLIDPSGNANSAVVYDHNADGSSNYGSVTMGDGTSDPVTVHNVASGVAATDAVNVSQLNAAIGQVINTGVGSNPMFAAQGDRDAEGANASGTHSMASGANALASGANAVAMGAGSAASGINATALGANASAGAQNAVALGTGSVADRDSTVSVGAAGSERQIVNVAAGTQSTDAVNVGQMNASLNQAGSQANNYTDQRIRQVQGSINDTSRKAYSGIAAATALTMIPDLQQGKNIAVGIGGAQYQGYGATAIGVNARVTGNLIVKAGAGISAAGSTYGVGGSYQW